MWVKADEFEYEKRFYWVLFQGHIRPVRCWPNAGRYTPVVREDAKAVEGLSPFLVYEGEDPVGHRSLVTMEIKSSSKLDLLDQIV